MYFRITFARNRKSIQKSNREVPKCRLFERRALWPMAPPAIRLLLPDKIDCLVLKWEATLGSQVVTQWDINCLPRKLKNSEFSHCKWIAWLADVVEKHQSGSHACKKALPQTFLAKAIPFLGHPPIPALHRTWRWTAHYLTSFLNFITVHRFTRGGWTFSVPSGPS